jgi:hypothetical protein
MKTCSFPAIWNIHYPESFTTASATTQPLAMSTLDDTVLIQQFIHGHATLAANQSLRVEPAFNSLQLLAKRGGLLAMLQQNNGSFIVLLRQGSEYRNLIRHILLENSFLPQGTVQQSEFEQYQETQIPAGYNLHCTEARVLWKEWWTTTRNNNRNGIQTDLLIFTRNTWYPVRDITSGHSTLFLKTLANELIFEGNQEVIWLKRSAEAEQEKPEGERQSFEPVSVRAYSLTNQPALQQTVASQNRRIPAPQTAGSTPERSQEALRDRLDTATLRPDLRDVLKMRQGKLYILTAIGEVVVEGEHLKFRLNQAQDRASSPFPALYDR